MTKAAVATLAQGLESCGSRPILQLINNIVVSLRILHFIWLSAVHSIEIGGTLQRSTAREKPVQLVWRSETTITGDRN